MSRGYFTVLVLVFTGVFFVLLTTLSGYIFVQKRVELAKENRSKAFQMAEAGLEYYRWHLAHWPDDLQNGTGQPGPYVEEVYDPEGGLIGYYSLAVSGGTFCGKTNTVEITATGWTVDDPTFVRTLFARYTRPTVAQYSTITNSNVWVGSDRVISGPYHSNGGIRMDGTHNADVTSGLTTWSCTSSFGCSPTVNQNGVFGGGGPQSLWRFPVPTVDFNGITIDLTSLKGYATSSGRYFGQSGSYGYRVTFVSDGTMAVAPVTGTTQVWGYTIENGWRQERPVISSVGASTNYTIPATCPVLFFEDNVWMQGVVAGKVVLASADVVQAGVTRSIILNDNITYASSSGNGLTAIAEGDVLVGLQVPDVMTISGVFLAQLGRFGRNHYCQNDCSSTSGSQGLPSALDQYVTRSTLTTNGTVMSNGRVGTKWTSGGAFISGFNTRFDNFDRGLSESPPPFTPSISDDYEFVRWSDQR